MCPIYSFFIYYIQIKKLLQIVNLLRRFCVCCCVCLPVSELPSSILSTINQHFMLSQFSKRKTIPTFISSPSGELERGCSPFFSLSVLNPDRMQMRMYIELGVYSQSLFYRLRCNSSWNCKYMQSFFIIFYLISSFSIFNFSTPNLSPLGEQGGGFLYFTITFFPPLIYNPLSCGFPFSFLPSMVYQLSFSVFSSFVNCRIPVVSPTRICK